MSDEKPKCKKCGAEALVYNASSDLRVRIRLICSQCGWKGWLR